MIDVGVDLRSSAPFVVQKCATKFSWFAIVDMADSEYHGWLMPDAKPRNQFGHLSVERIAQLVTKWVGIFFLGVPVGLQLWEFVKFAGYHWFGIEHFKLGVSSVSLTGSFWLVVYLIVYLLLLKFAKRFFSFLSSYVTDVVNRATFLDGSFNRLLGILSGFLLLAVLWPIILFLYSYISNIEMPSINSGASFGMNGFLLKQAIFLLLKYCLYCSALVVAWRFLVTLTHWADRTESGVANSTRH